MKTNYVNYDKYEARFEATRPYLYMQEALKMAAEGATKIKGEELCKRVHLKTRRCLQTSFCMWSGLIKAGNDEFVFNDYPPPGEKEMDFLRGIKVGHARTHRDMALHGDIYAGSGLCGKIAPRHEEVISPTSNVPQIKLKMEK